MARSSSILFTFVGVSLPIAAHLEDMNETHIYNSRWPPHAKFHDAQTMSLSVLLGGLTTYLAWRSTDDVPLAVVATGGVASLYFITQSTAILYPGTAFFDPEFKALSVAKVPAPIVLDLAYLAVIGLASWLGLRNRLRPNLVRRLLNR